ncbi:hypothetical protein Rumeso_00118 [Rubellimicrobium mesophilum DSM 19309]|uniref:AAA+ family ATPase n=1 Tax=Rubellimicrobium mesophilum DSM 19309 TaxID=442562 RepID=A0A017HX09_9RHOB|nr:hypothetical protein [Rubellimicrobium mesophilum]EYD78289.1 hypothetical protein Rumeso_00118 [Rubellimicrobium mesophilum DSM 19309]
MRRLILAAALVAAPLAGHAQDSSDDGNDLLREGANLFLRGLLEDVQPPLQELAGITVQHLAALQAFLDEMGPAFAEVVGQIDSVTYYEPPEILPNGDIVFRRRADAPPWQPAEATPDESEPAPSEPTLRAPAPSEPDDEAAPWTRPPPEAEPDNQLHIDPSRDMEL